MQSWDKWRGGHGYRQTCEEECTRAKTLLHSEGAFVAFMCKHCSLLSEFIVTTKSCSKLRNDGATKLCSLLNQLNRVDG